jgi:hypothetical protein
MAAFMLYVMAAPPGFYWLDSAELSAAAVGLGVPRATGFPLYCILARAAAFVPLGELAFRVELLSAACAALAVFWTTRLVIELCRGDGHALVGAAVAGTLLATAAVIVRQATVAEVYAPGAALLAGGLLLLDHVSRGGDARWGLALALVCGLSLGAHASAWLLAPVAVTVMAVRLYRGARWPLLAPLVALAMAGAALAYLPVRSASGPAMLDRGHPATAGALLAHVAGRQGGADAQEHGGHVGEAGAGADAGAESIEDMGDQVGPLAPLAAVFGLVWLARQRRSRWLAAALAVIGLGGVLFVLWGDSPGRSEWQHGVPLAVAVAVCAGAGVAWLSRFLRAAGPFAGAVAGVLLVVPSALVSLPAVWPASGPGADRGVPDVPRAWAEAALAATPPRGLTVVQEGSMAAGMLYLTEIERARPDVAVLVRQRLGDPAHVRAALARAGVDAAGPEATIDAGAGAGAAGAAGVAAILDWLLQLDRPVAWEPGRVAVPAGTDVRLAAPLVLLVPGRTDDGQGRETDRASRNRSLVRAAQTVARIFAGPGGRDRMARREQARALTALRRMAEQAE